MNQNRRIIILILAMGIPFCACQKNRPNIVKTYYQNGKLRSAIAYIKDSIKDGRALYYYPSGQIKREEFYRDDVLDSSFKEYHENGKLKRKGNYSFGGNIMGSFYYYNETGNLRAYNAKDYLGKTFYVVKFNQLGAKVKEDGIAVSPSVGSLNYKKIYRPSDTLDLIFSIAEPPGYRDVVIIEEINENGNHSSYSGNVSRSSVIYRKILKTKGNYKVKCIVSLWDKDSLVRTDSTAITVVVE